MTNEYYSLLIDKSTGMIESLKLRNSNFELVCDVAVYSLFFSEYLHEPDGNYSNAFNYPPRHSDGVDISILENSDSLGVVSVNWDTGQLNSKWEFIFQRNAPTFRAAITRTVVQSGVYSNAQHCVMYSADMDMSYLINYEGNLLVTQGSYDGSYEAEACQSDARDYLPATTTHSLWTVFDYGKPKYLPAFIWWKADENITVGVITTWTSENQRATVSYHGGGSSQSHPGYAEGQWNWFGKSDSESLYLTAGTSYSMELIFYQNYGHIDTLLDYVAERINPEAYLKRNIEDYRVASWGGRSSPSSGYFWRYPQISSNEITSQRLFRPQAFAIPRSQNGMRENHLFSFSVGAIIDGAEVVLTPNYGLIPLFESLDFEQNDSGWIGSMAWIVDGLETSINYQMLLDQSEINVFGDIRVSQPNLHQIEGVSLNLDPSNRASYEYDESEIQLKFKAKDSVLDSIEIGVVNLEGVESVFEGTKRVKLVLSNNSQGAVIDEADYSYSMQLVPKIYADPEGIASGEFKSYFVKPASKGVSSEIFIEPSADYYCLGVEAEDENLKFDFWVQNPISEIFIYSENVLPNYLYNETKVVRYPVQISETKDVYRIICSLNRGVHSLSSFFQSTSAGVEWSSVHPNPNLAGEFKINIFSNHYQSGNLTVYNIKGQVIESFPIVANGRDYQVILISLDQSRYASGVYILKADFPQSTQIQKITYLKE